MLKTEMNSQQMGKRVLAAARKSVRLHTHKEKLTADFEHGQWWIHELETGAAWSVIDAEGGPAVDGFDFEQVTQGDNEY